MTVEDSNTPHKYTLGPASNGFTPAIELVSMPQLSTELVVLTFLYEHELPLQPKTIYGGLINLQDITFSYSTVQNKIRSLAEKGDVKKVKIDQQSGRVEELNPDESSRRAYYLITDQGKERVESEVL